jgi:hypothetical protein
MSDKRIQFSNIVRNQLPSYVKEEFPLVSEFLSQYYLSQEFQGAPVDLIQNIDKYIKVDRVTNQVEYANLLENISSIDTTIFINTSSTPTGTNGFPDSYGLLKIDDEIITYTGKTFNSFTGCIRGFSGISSYTSQNQSDQLVFSKTESADHSSGSTITNLSSLFLREFLLKIKHQLTPGFENREFVDGINDSLFIKQSKDFYRSKGTDQSFKILFKSLYGEDVSIIRPREYLFRPSDAQFQITNDLVVESIEGNPEDLKNNTLYQNEYLNFTKAYAPITKVEKLRSKNGKEYYKLSIDANYNRDIGVDGAQYGQFKIHPQTKVIGQYNSFSSTIDVDSTIGFPLSGDLFVTYNDDSTGVIKYTSKSINQFFGCSNITGIIEDLSVVSINTYASSKNESIKVKITSVLGKVDIVDDTFYLKKGYISDLKTLGVNPKDFASNNWLFNISPSYLVESILLIDDSDKTYKVTTKVSHIFKIGDTLKIKGNDNIEKNSFVIDIISDKSFIIKGQGDLLLSDSYIIQKNILKTNSPSYPNTSIFNSNIQNIYKNKNKVLVASPSLPYYGNQSLNISNREILFSGTFDSNTFKITTNTDHGFYTGDAVYYTPEKITVQSFDEDGNTIETTSIVTSIFNEGIYFIQRVNSNTVRFSLSRSDIYNSRFLSVDNPVTVNLNKLTYYNFNQKTLTEQKLLREIDTPVNDGGVYTTEPGFTGILINGVEILNYKSRDVVYAGPLTEIEVTSPGQGYDIINPPILSIEDPIGVGASGYCAVKGSLQEIRVVDPGFDYDEVPVIKITGGNGIGAKAFANMKLIDHQSTFNSEINSAQISLFNNTIGFTTFHKFRNAEQVIYTTSSQSGVGGLSTDASYYVSVQSPIELKLHKTLNDAVSGINTISFTSFGIGNHSLRSYNKKLVLGSVNIVNSGTGYENKKRTIFSTASGINTAINQININTHDFRSGEIVKYSTSGSVIGGLINNTEYYITVVDNNSFRLSQIGSGLQSKDFFYNTRQFLDLTSIGSGIHTFNYPEISVEVVGNVNGSVQFKAQVQPIFRGEITSVHLESGGTNYGSPDILNHNRKPTIRILRGSGAQVTPIISNGRIIQVLVNSFGSGYNSNPDLNILGDGIGAVLTPIIKNGALVEVKVVESGIGYSSSTTVITVTPSGSLAEFSSKIKIWNVNLFQKLLPFITEDDGILSEGLNENYGLQYSHLYAPRRLREIVYATDQDGNTLYGKKDLRKLSNKETNSTDHSPIIGWAYDGNPIYGPYGYLTKQGGIVAQMKSGYKIDLKSNRPPLTSFPQGFFVEDYTHFSVSDETVLDENNGRFCLTPEYPNGTYAYFSTINNGLSDSSGVFAGFKRPVFPFFIGNEFKSRPNEFNFKKYSNQEDIDLNQTKWSRNTTPYNLTENEVSYNYLELPNNLNQTLEVKFASSGSVENIEIISGGFEYKIGDKVIFDNEETQGSNASAEVERILGKPVNTISVASTTLFNVEFYPSGNQETFVAFAENPHNLINSDTINLSGFNTTSSLLEGSYKIQIITNNISLTSSIGNTSISGIVTYFSVSGNLNYPNIRENDVLGIGTEQVKVLNIDAKSSRIRVLRAINGTVGSSHSSSDILYEIPRKLIINTGLTTQYDHKVNREIYFNPIDSLGIGAVSGVGIGTTIVFSNPGVGITQIFIPTQSIYIPNHQLLTGDELIYSSNGGVPIGVSTNGISTSVSISDQSVLYVAKFNENLIGISTFRVGLGTQGTFVGLTSNTNTFGLLYFTNFGTKDYHSFKTTYNTLVGNISRNTVKVSTSQTHGLLNNDTVFVNVNPSISTTFTLRYNDYNKKVLLNPKDFISSGINTTTNTITINNHGFLRGQKVIYTSQIPSIGLDNNKEYYIVIVDNNNIKLTNSYFESKSPKPSIVNITSASDGTLSLINPPINVYKNSFIVFDLSDSSLSYTQQSTTYPAFDFRFFKDSNLTEIYDSNTDNNIFEVQKIGVVGVTSDAKVTLTVNQQTPENLYYNLVPIYNGTLPENKKLISIDSDVISNNEILVKSSIYNGEYNAIVGSTTSFTYTIPSVPEKDSYISNQSSLSYETTSKNTSGTISKIKLVNKGQNYYSLPQITSVDSAKGIGSILEPTSKSIGKIKTTRIKDIGFNFPSDFTVRPSVAIPQIIKVDALSSLDSIQITSFGKGYISAPKLLVLDGRTGKVVPEIDIKLTLGNNKVEILENSFGLSNSTPTILPIQNSNGVGISSIRYEVSTNEVTVNLSVGFSTENSFPFNINDKVLIENISVGINSTGKGFNSENYNYQLFNITSVNTNIGGFGSVTYSLDGLLNNSEIPGIFDPNNSSGRIIPEKYFPKFNVVLGKNNYFIGEKVISNSAQGRVEDWDSKLNFIKIVSKNNFKVGEIIKGSSSRTQGIVSNVDYFDAFFNLTAVSRVENGWKSNAGFFNDNIQRIQDSLYYQNFSYSLKSRVDFNTWDNVVSTLNHTSGFKKFSDYQLESNLNVETSNSLVINLPSNITSIDSINDIIGIANLNCVYDFDLVRENALYVSEKIFSDEIIFSNRILQDYAESIGNRVLSIDDISSQFNSNPRPTRFSEVSRFNLGSLRSQKHIAYIKDTRFVDEKQLLLITTLRDNIGNGYLNQYARVESTYDMGSFDFVIDGSEGILLFYPTKFSINDFNITTLSYNIDDNISGIGSTNFDGIVEIRSNSTSVSSGSTTILGISTNYRSAKVLVSISTDDNIYQFDELTVIHDGVNVELLEYGQLTNYSFDAFSGSGLGTYYPYISGSQLIVDFISNAGIVATINTISTLFVAGDIVGVGTYTTKHAKLEGRSTSIASTSTPSPSIVYQSDQIFDSEYAIVQVSDFTNNIHQISEVAIVNTKDEGYITEYAVLNTLSGLGTIGLQKFEGTNAITFTPLPDINVNVKIYSNALRHEDGEKEVISFVNSQIETNYAIYEGTERDIKRKFKLTHNNNSIFEKYFDGGNSSIVDIISNTITIPNHFFVSGELVKYSNPGFGSTQAIGIAQTSFIGVGLTNKLPKDVYVVKVDSNSIKLSKSSEDALSVVPKTLEITNAGIGSFHKFTSTNQNAKVILAIDNLIQSPVVSTSTTTTLATNALTTNDIIYFSEIASFFGGDLIRIEDEIMRIEGVGIGSTNGIRVRRPWLGTAIAGYSTGSLVTKVSGNYNIVDNDINFAEAPYGNILTNSTTNVPDERDWTGISTGSSFQGRSFIRSGIINSAEETYSKNYIFSDISSEFNGITKEFTLKYNGSNVYDIKNNNAVILINDIFQGPGSTYDYTLSESVGITSIKFTGTATSVSYDVNNASIPRGGTIVSIGSTKGFGYQPLVSAGGTATVSIAGTIASISIGNSGSGYRSPYSYEILVNTSFPIGIGSTFIYLENTNSVFSILNLLNTGSNCSIGVGTFIRSDSGITSIGSTFIQVGSGATSSYQIPSGTEVSIKITNSQIGFANVSVANSSVGIATVTHIGYSTIISGSISTNVTITNPGFGFTTSNLPLVIIEDPLSYNNIPLIYTSSPGIGTQATINIVVGQGSDIIDFEITNTGYGYRQDEILTISTGGITGIPTTGNSFSQFEISIQKTSKDKFSGWSIGELQVLDRLDDKFDNENTSFPLTITNNLISIRSSKGSNINIQDTLLVFINDILQKPGEGYTFPGGSIIRFSEPPKIGDTSKILFYRGSGSIDVVDVDILETVKTGDELTIGYDSYIEQSSTLQEEERTVTRINSTDLLNTNPYFGPGNTRDENLERPVTWCRQTEDKIINEQKVSKDRIFYNAIINPISYLIQPVGVGSTIAYVDSIRPFFNQINESGTSLTFQNKVTFIPQEPKVGASATAIVSVAGTITSVQISDGGVGYVTAPTVVIQNSVGIGTTIPVNATAGAFISSGIVTTISIENSGIGYTFANPPIVLVEPPSFKDEINNVNNYEGDFGYIVGISTGSVGVALTAIIFDFYIPENSFLKNSSITGVTTISGIQTGYYFIVHNSNIGNTVTSLDFNGSIVGVGTTFMDNVYQVSSVSIAQTSVIGVGITYVKKVVVSIQDYNSFIPISSSDLFGEYSWGKITLSNRSKNNNYNSYTLNGISGLTTSTILKRTNPLKFSHK